MGQFQSGAITWDLGYLVEPVAVGIGGDTPIVIARLPDSGYLRILGLSEEVVILDDREVGSSVYELPRLMVSDEGALVVTGTRSVRFDSDLPWTEGFVWRPD